MSTARLAPPRAHPLPTCGLRDHRWAGNRWAGNRWAGNGAVVVSTLLLACAASPAASTGAKASHAGEPAPASTRAPLLDARPTLSPLVDTTTEPPPPASRAVPAAAWTDCYRSFRPGGDPSAALARLTRACGPLGGMQPQGPRTLAEQTAAERPDLYALEVPAGGACYRVFAVGDPGVNDLDLLIRDAEQPLAGDVSTDAWPVVPPRGPLCLPDAGRYLVEVSVSQGAGSYALEVWTTR